MNDIKEFPEGNNIRKLKQICQDFVKNRIGLEDMKVEKEDFCTQCKTKNDEKKELHTLISCGNLICEKCLLDCYFFTGSLE